MDTNTTCGSTRWDRLAAALTEAGLKPELRTHKFWGGTYHRPVEKTGYHIYLTAPDGGMITIGDRFWSKNPDVWVGYTAWREDREGIVKRDMRWTKKRDEGVAFVKCVLQ